ncbi:MAG: TIM barrel protein [Candidatus Limnocylindrales bacterium]
MGLTQNEGVHVAAAPVSWGVFEQTGDDPRQLGPEQMLDQMAAAGYEGTELGPPGFFGEAAVMKRRLASRKLSLVGSFLPLRFSRAEHIEADLEWMAGVLDLLEAGRPDGVMPKAVLADASVEPERMRWAGQIDAHPEASLSEARFTAFVDNIHRAADLARVRGLDPVLHFHAGSYCESSTEIHRVYDALDLSLVGMCLDTGHALFGGADPLELLETYGAAVRLVHIKDCDLELLAQVCSSGGGMTEAWDRGVFCELGLGTAGLEPFLEALKARGYEGWITVEQDRFVKDEDTPEALLALHTRNREWLAARGF